MSLARAVYHQADIYLLDDPLSAVDAAVAKHLFEKYYLWHISCHTLTIFFSSCIRRLLKDKLVILVTHQVQFAIEADKLLLLKEVVDGHVSCTSD